MKQFIALFFLIFFVSVSVHSQTTESEVPADFVSDGCSWFPDGAYRDCCEAHDRDYYNGGTCKQRRESDNRLYRCVRSKDGWKHKVIAPIMWVGVRVLGTSWLPTPFRWGFGKDREKKNRKMQVFNKPQPETSEENSNVTPPVPPENTDEQLSESKEAESNVLTEEAEPVK